HWDEQQQQCVEDNCDPGYHWDEQQQQCVPDASTDCADCPDFDGKYCMASDVGWGCDQAIASKGEPDPFHIVVTNAQSCEFTASADAAGDVNLGPPFTGCSVNIMFEGNYNYGMVYINGDAASGTIAMEAPDDGCDFTFTQAACP
ncbi:MAG: hypothetical protein ACOCVR_03890, partial [Myxococcota bacterium]